MITCAEAVRQLWDYLENDVAPDERGAVEEHLAFCRRCCGEVEFAKELRTVLAAGADMELPPDVETRLGGFLSALDATPPASTDNGDGDDDDDTTLQATELP